MSATPPFDAAQAHRFFSAECFNRAWDLIDKAERSPEEEEQMLLLPLASIWHWTQRPDCTPRNLSIGYWQASRVCALLGDQDNAWRFAEKCLEHSADEPPFYLGYAHEALARAALLAGDRKRLAHHLGKARELAAIVADEDERTMLQRDLGTLG